jgi:hypothetical protein
MENTAIPPSFKKPNETESTKTTLPLLATVLAGFSVTIIAQLLIQPHIEQVWPITNYLLFLGLLLLAFAVLFLLASTVFAIFAQPHDFTVLSEKELKQGDRAFLSRELALWKLYHRAAVNAFKLGVLAFAIGTVILYWNYLGNVFAGICFVMVIACFIWGFTLRNQAHKLKK